MCTPASDVSRYNPIAEGRQAVIDIGSPVTSDVDHTLLQSFPVPVRIAGSKVEFPTRISLVKLKTRQSKSRRHCERQDHRRTRNIFSRSEIANFVNSSLKCLWSDSCALVTFQEVAASWQPFVRIMPPGVSSRVIEKGMLRWLLRRQTTP